MTLVEHFESDFKANAGGDISSKWHQINEKSPFNPSKALTYGAFMKLKHAVLAAYSYVEISLGEYILALKHAEELIKIPDLPDAYV